MIVSSLSFSIGYRFYYWPFYQDLDVLPVNEYKEGKITDHSGYKVKDLYVQKKHGSFKDEIMNYTHLDIDEYNVMMLKAKEYLDTETVKCITANTRYAPKHYGIDDDSELRTDNLIALILYTDFTTLSSKFTASFRKISTFETLDSVKTRNRNYWWLSKILRETVELYGECRFIDGLCGPFYCGMSYLMTVPSFAIRLCSPTSTSKQIQVATKFSGDSGVIIQFNTPEKDGFEYLKAFDCSFISRFKEEDERY